MKSRKNSCIEKNQWQINLMQQYFIIISRKLSTVLPGLVIYHQLRDFWRPNGDKILVQITSDLLVISYIGQNLGNFKPFLVKIGDFSAIFQQTFLEIFYKPFTKFSN